MKRIIFIGLMLCIVFNVNAQNLPIDTATNKVIYSDVVKVDSAFKDELYNRCRTWFANTFVSSNKVLQMDDKEAGQLIGHAAVRSSFVYFVVTYKFTLTYSISVSIKDGKYKYKITDFEAKDDDGTNDYTLDEIATGKLKNGFKTRNSKGEYKSLFSGYTKTTDEQAQLIISSLKKAMSSNQSKKDDF